jgi:hypothetical protein
MPVGEAVLVMYKKDLKLLKQRCKTYQFLNKERD